MLSTLDKKYPHAVAELRKRGYTAIADMTAHFGRISEMSRALGLADAGSGVSKWLTRANAPTWANNQRAADWLAAQAPNPSPPPAPVAAPVAALAPQLPPATIPATTVFLATCAPADSARVQKILALLNCDFVEV